MIMIHLNPMLVFESFFRHPGAGDDSGLTQPINPDC